MLKVKEKNIKLNYYLGLFIVLLFSSSCTNNKIFTEKEKKIDLSNKKLEGALNCPNYFIPEDTKYLLGKSKIKVLKISSIKLKCINFSSTTDNKNQKISINQTIYYQVLDNNAKLNKNNSLVYLALVDENKNNIKAKVLLKIKKSSFIKIREKIYFKNNYNFVINNNEKNKNLTFYYGFQK